MYAKRESRVTSVLEESRLPALTACRLCLDANADPLPILGHISSPGRDVGCFVTVQYTPVNTDGERGPTVSEAAAARVEEGIPVVSELKIVGTFEEGQTVHVDAWYCGGQQGDSDITWLAVAEKEAEQQDVIELASSASRELKIPFVAIGRVLEVRAATLEPVSSRRVRKNCFCSRAANVVAF